MSECTQSVRCTINMLCEIKCILFLAHLSSCTLAMCTYYTYTHVRTRVHSASANERTRKRLNKSTLLSIGILDEMKTANRISYPRFCFSDRGKRIQIQNEMDRLIRSEFDKCLLQRA